jgi:glutamate synthase domain-containing protein 1
MDEDAFERKLYVARKRAEAEIAHSESKRRGMFYVPSLSCRTIVYKGLLLAPQIANFYGELSDPEVESALCLVHQRFLDEYIPELAACASLSLRLRTMGEINTVRGERELDACAPVNPVISTAGDDLKKLFPIITPAEVIPLRSITLWSFLVQAGLRCRTSWRC